MAHGMPNFHNVLQVYVDPYSGYKANERPPANWLPSPQNGEFSLYVRAYWPDDAITRGQWTPPAVVKVR